MLTGSVLRNTFNISLAKVRLSQKSLSRAELSLQFHNLACSYCTRSLLIEVDKQLPRSYSKELDFHDGTTSVHVHLARDTPMTCLIVSHVFREQTEGLLDVCYFRCTVATLTLFQTHWLTFPWLLSQTTTPNETVFRSRVFHCSSSVSVSLLTSSNHDLFEPIHARQLHRRVCVHP
ncbi:uncharacterized protein YALI1_A16314g [Yarrowia lipolytica]|uniref:Uncharacterized protein n=1 Tax=Yarrowia lipolytica TaxID=4952 RepID=A0A1D8N503_YARLL|nr:hypothetical protein YALI1_A16314g [Yarrowia lipolytica]